MDIAVRDDRKEIQKRLQITKHAFQRMNRVWRDVTILLETNSAESLCHVNHPIGLQMLDNFLAGEKGIGTTV